MTRGAKKPISHHKKTGNYRPSRHGGPELPVAIPDMPEDMSEVARECWNAIAGHLAYMGVVAVVDDLALRVLCETYATYRQAADEVEANGLTFKCITDNGEMIRKNPAVNSLENARKDLYAMMKQFGLNPLARNGIKSGQKQTADRSEEEEIADILKFG